MRKGILVLLIVLLCLMGGSYLFIGHKIRVSEVMNVEINQQAAYRSLLQENTWTKWWPDDGEGQAGSPAFRYNGYSFSIDQKLFSGVAIQIKNNKESYASVLSVFPLSTYKSIIEWKYEINTSKNPLTRIQNFFTAQKLQNHTNELLGHLKNFLEKKENVYGFRMQQVKVKDTVLLATRMHTIGYPAVESIYSNIQKLKKYITANGAKEMDIPMLNVRTADSIHYEAMIAIPVNKILPQTEYLFLKRMILGNLLLTEVRGGPHTINEALKQMERYMSDYKKVSPAIPFESLVTDRSKEKDTAKWITRIYYPVFDRM